ncbi:MAG: Calx-beta domain-containing protein [Caldilineaceae bacterium]
MPTKYFVVRAMALVPLTIGLVIALFKLSSPSFVSQIHAQTIPPSPPTVQFSASNYTVNENAGVATITVTLSAQSNISVTVGYETMNGTATSGNDFDGVSGTLVFNPGETTKSFTVSIINDTEDETDEFVNIYLLGVHNGISGTITHTTITILDDDAAPPTPTATPSPTPTSSPISIQPTPIATPTPISLGIYITPSNVPISHSTVITITGGPFQQDTKVRLGSAINLPVNFVSSERLTATVPAGLASGWYTATVTNPSTGSSTSLVNALRVDGTGPVAGTLKINGVALQTTSTQVRLSMTASDSTDPVNNLSMSFSNDAQSWSGWRAFSSISDWTTTDGDGVKTVYVRFQDPATNQSAVVSATIDLDTTAPPDYGLSLNDGALYTNKISVTLTIGARPGTSLMQISNDGGFAGAVWQPYETHLPWGITQYGNYTIPRVVYVRYKNSSDDGSSNFSDDIILDITPPTGSVQIASWLASNHLKTDAGYLQLTGGDQVQALQSHAVFLPLVQQGTCTQSQPPNVALKLQATDDVSGVGGMLISNSIDFACANWETFNGTKAWYLPADASNVYIKFRDNAGNVSSVISTKNDNK